MEIFRQVTYYLGCAANFWRRIILWPWGSWRTAQARSDWT